MERPLTTEFTGEPVNRLTSVPTTPKPPSFVIPSGVHLHAPLEAETSVADLMYFYKKVPERSPKSAEAMAEMARQLTQTWDEEWQTTPSASLDDLNSHIIRIIQGWLRLRYPKAALHLAEWYVAKFGDEVGLMAPFIRSARAALQEKSQAEASSQ